MSDSDTSLFKRLQLYCQVSALAAMGVGGLVLFGWGFHIKALLSVFPGHVTMKVNTALGLMFAGISLWLLLPGESSTRRGKIARFLALVVVLIGVATLIEYFFGLNLGIDQLIFGDPLGSNGTSSPGRLAPTTATAFIAIGLALTLLDSKAPPVRWTAQALSLWSGVIAMSAINGYLYHAVVLSRIWLYTQVAIHTAIGLLLLSGGVFFARPRSGIAGDLTGEGSGSLMARRLLPAVFLVPIVLGWIALQGEFAGLYGAEIGLALYATVSVLVFAVLVWSNARKMNGEYDQRSQAETDIRELNAELERRVAERTTHLAQMEGRYRGLLEAAPDAMVVVNVGGDIVLLNVQTEKQFGYSRDELIGQKVKNIIPEGFAERLIADGTRSAAEALAQQIGTGIELIGRRKDGSEFPIEIMLSPLESLEGILVTAAIRDISVRKGAETHLAQMEGRYRGLLEAAPDAMVVVNVGGDIVLLNVRAEKEFGYSRDELIGQKVKNIIPEGFAERIIADGTRSAAEALAQQIGTGIELIGRRKDGSDFPIEIMLSPLESPEGILVTAAIRDISLRKGAETHLAQMEGRYRGLLEAAPDAMVVVNVGGDIVLLNVRAEKEFGYSRDELVGQKMNNIVPTGFAERLIADALRTAEDALAQQIGTGIELTGRRKDGSEFPIEIMLSPLESPEGILVTAAIRDISTRKKAEANLLHKMSELYRSNEELGQFAYIASHDLQEPLRMVASYTQLLSRRYKGQLDAEADEFITFAVDGANRMQRLIQDLLAFSRVGTKGRDLLETSSEQALRQALKNLRGAIEESGAVVTYDPLPSVLADEMQLTQLFQNLIGNAIKYQNPGSVPRVHISASRNGEEKWILSVKDNGLGIAPEYFEKIFGMFQRLHKREEFAGTGIGLAICKKIAERHGTSISVESALGQGATFHFALEGSEKRPCSTTAIPMEATLCQ
jgi:PAS domain S-box-containing protein